MTAISRKKLVGVAIETIKLSPCYCLQCVMSSENSCVVVCVNVLARGQVDVMSIQNSCVVVHPGQCSSGGFERRKFRLFSMAKFYSFYCQLPDYFTNCGQLRKLL